MSSVFEAIFGGQRPTVEFEMQTCITCGVNFSAPKEFFDHRRKDGKNFFCPSGHQMAYTKTEADRLREQIAQKDRDLEWTRGQRDSYKRKGETLERRLRATKGVVTRIKKRIAAGLCPCCKETFQDLAEHMSVKHPDYAGSEVANA